MNKRRTDLAWANLVHQRLRLLVAAGGIGLAVLLMFAEIGFYNALLDSSVRIVDVLNADLVLCSKAKYALTVNRQFDRLLLQKAQGVEGVVAAYPLYIEPYLGQWRPNQGGKTHPIRVIAYELGQPVFRWNDPVDEALLVDPSVALTDRKNKRRNFGIPSHPDELLAMDGAELSSRSIRLAGLFDLGTDFVNDGNLLMSAENFARYFPMRARGRPPLSQVDLGVVHIDPAADPEEVCRRLRDALGSEVDVFTKAGFIDRERNFWDDSTPIGFVFALGAAMGFVVGVVMCYQIIYADITDHLAEFATLKAMGYSNGHFLGVVAREAMYLSMLGFVPGLACSWLTYALLSWWTGLPLEMTWERVAFVYGITLLMCGISAGLSIRKLLTADPATLF